MRNVMRRLCRICAEHARMKQMARLMALAALMMVVVSCGDPAAGPGKSAVFLVVDGGDKWGIRSDVYDATKKGYAEDSLFELTVKSEKKDPSGNTDLSVYSDVILEEYRVTYYRVDGNPNVPAPMTIAMHSRVSVGASTDLRILLVSRSAKLKSPLKELAFGGGEGTILLQAAVTFYGKDLSGNAVTADYTIFIEAGDFAAEG